MSNTTKFEISPAPIVTLYTWVFAVLCVVALLLLLLYNPEGWTQPPGIMMVGAWVFNLLMGVGVVSVFSYISGPEVHVESEGIRVHSSWMLDKAYLRRRNFFIAWHEVQAVRETRFFNMPYWVLSSGRNGETVAIPQFLRDPDAFLDAVKAASPAVYELLGKPSTSS